MTQINSYLIREKVIKALRQFFDKQHFHEIIPPVLNRALPLEPNLFSFKTRWQKFEQAENLYLPCSPESALKKSLAQGIEPCYALAPSFRNLEPADLEHNPEFLMLEWYRAESDYNHIMQDCQDLIRFVAQKVNGSLNVEYQDQQIDLSRDWPVFSIAELFEQVTGVKLNQVLTLESITSLAGRLGYETKNSNWEQLFNQIVINLIEPELSQSACFLLDFPAKISPLCQVRPDYSYLARRFELYLGGLELANGNNEQTNAKLVRKRFEKEQKYRRQQSLPTHPADETFLNALDQMDQKNTRNGSYAGVGLGVDRLAMILANETKLSAVNPFTL